MRAIFSFLRVDIWFLLAKVCIYFAKIGFYNVGGVFTYFIGGHKNVKYYYYNFVAPLQKISQHI